MGTNASMKLETINQLAHKDMLAVNALIQKQVDSEVSLINQLGFYIVNSGGKRLRPLLTILAARALDIQTGAASYLGRYYRVYSHCHTASR